MLALELARWRLLAVASPATLFEGLFHLSWYRELHVEWVEALPLVPGQRVLEVGCGPGALAEHLAGRQLLVTGVDRSRRMVRRARRRRGGLEVQRGDATRLPFPAASFDHALAASVINATADPGSVLREMARVTKPQGTVSFLVPSPQMTGEAAATFADRRELADRSRAALLLWARAARKVAPEAAVGLAREAGLGSPAATASLDGMIVGITGACRGEGSRPVGEVGRE